MQMRSQSFSAGAGGRISQTALKAAAVQTVSDETLSFPLLPVERERGRWRRRRKEEAAKQVTRSLSSETV